MGIPEEGTTDYRNVALQFRYEYSSKGAFVIQFSDERLGSQSPVQPFIDGVQLNWVFYERHLFDGTTVKAGKFPVPLGIYNEILHVGTILPFYRPAFNLYGDGGFTSETISGAGLYQTIPLGSSWSLEADLYAGEWPFFQQAYGTVIRSQSKDVWGGQLWLYTPIEGLRLGLGGFRSTDSNLFPPHAPTDKGPDKNWYVSLDGRFDRFILQSEYRRTWTLDYDWYDYYVLAGVKVIRDLTVLGQAEHLHVEFPGVPPLTYSIDYTFGLRYAFDSNLVLKAEQHLQKGFYSDIPIPDYLGDPVKQNYYIISLAVSF